MNQPIDVDTLRRVGLALYGPRWQSALATDLGVTDRNLRRWLAGEHGMSADIGDSLSRLIAARRSLLQALASELAKKNSAIARNTG